MLFIKHDTEYKIELEAERMMDRLDAAFLDEGSDMTIQEYNLQCNEIELWVKLRLREIG